MARPGARGKLPGVNPSRWRDVNQLFHDLLERPAAEREQRLAEIESGDVEIAREVRSLLASHERAPRDL